MTKTCPICGNTFYPIKCNQIYCSFDCREKARCQRRCQRNKSKIKSEIIKSVRKRRSRSAAISPKSHTCWACHNPFVPSFHNQKFCSDNCRSAFFNLP